MKTPLLATTFTDKKTHSGIIRVFSDRPFTESISISN